MKKLKYFLALLLVLFLTVGVIMFPDMYYTFFDRNIVGDEPVKGSYNFSRTEDQLTPTQVYRLLTGDEGFTFESPIKLSLEEVQQMLKTAVTGLWQNTKTDINASSIIFDFMEPDAITDFTMESFYATVDSQPLSLNLITVHAIKNDMFCTVTFDANTKLVYRFVVRSNTYGDESSFYTPKDLFLDIVEYWELEDSQIICDIIAEVNDFDEMTVSILNIDESDASMIQE